jgi:hypothetical protein
MEAPFGAAIRLNLDIYRDSDRKKLTSVGHRIHRFCLDVAILGMDIVYRSSARPLSKSNIVPVVNAE